MLLKLVKLGNNFHKLVTDRGCIYFSYETPIGAHISSNGGNQIIVSDQRFSNTTSKHQSFIDGKKSGRVPHQMLLDIINEVFQFDNEPEADDGNRSE